MSTSIKAPGHETWHNNMAGRIYIKRYGDFGQVKTELIQADKNFTLTPDERRMNENESVPALNMFTNGTLSPVSLVEGEMDNERLLRSPNNVTEEDVEQIIGLKGERLEARLETITSLTVMDRLIEEAKKPHAKVYMVDYQRMLNRRSAIDAPPVRETPPEPTAGDLGGVPEGTLRRGVTPR